MVTKVDLMPMPFVERTSPVHAIQYDADGRIAINAEELKQLVFRGGVEHELRSVLWKFLLDYYDW